MKLTDLSGVGAKRVHALNLAGIHTIDDLLNYFPRDYDDRSEIKTVAELLPDAVNTIRGIVAFEPENAMLSRKSAPNKPPLHVTKVVVKDYTGQLEITWFNQPYLKKYFKKGSEYIFTGKVRAIMTGFGGARIKLQMQSPDYEPCGDVELSGGRIVPVYTTPAGYSQKTFRALIYQALEYISPKFSSDELSRQTIEKQMRNQCANVADQLQGLHQFNIFTENMPDTIMKSYGLIPRRIAIQNIHFPESNTLFLASRRRFVFEELFFMQLTLLQLKGAVSAQPGEIFADTDCLPFLNQLPFALTDAQSKVLTEIKSDLSSGRRMNRLVQGDVGSGKTAIAMAMAFAAIKNNRQAALMAPTDVLAGQHYEQCTRFLTPLGYETVLLTGSIGAKAKKEALAQIADGTAHMIVGTHALIQKGVAYHQLGLVITDEQHRFGVNQRMILTEKAMSTSDTSPTPPHTLVMTATPIPRTLGMILYGDLDISIIDELPPGRQVIQTYCVNTTYRPRLQAFIRKETAAGRQVYIICPAIEESLADSQDKNAEQSPQIRIIGDLPESFESNQPLNRKAKIEMQNVLNYTDKLKQSLPELNIAYLHGRMKPIEKNEIMDNFKSGQIQVLVSTTVIEVGVHVANATLMIVENAERFGLSQLHQLRGRVGRGQHQSYCVLITDTKNEETKARMTAMTSTTDGFKLAELDLKLRGAGDFFGTRQHGLPNFSIANLYKDMDILKEAQQAALDVTNDTIFLSEAETQLKNKQIAKVITNTYGDVM